MNISTILLYAFEIITAGAALAILLTRNIFYAALFTLICLLGIAAIFVLLNAEFLGVTQLMIYAGGVVVILLFGIMMTQRVLGKPLLDKNKRMFPALVTGGLILIILIKSINQLNTDYTTNSNKTNTIEWIGTNLMSTYVLPFEVIGILLLVALISAAVSASAAKSDKQKTA